MPECNVNLAHCVTYMALAPKSNALYNAYAVSYTHLDVYKRQSVVCGELLGLWETNKKVNRATCDDLIAEVVRLLEKYLVD